MTEEIVAGMRSNFHPFTRPGAYLGKNVTYAEVMITIARTLHRLGVLRVPGSMFGGESLDLGWGASNEKEMYVQDAFVALRQGPEMQFRRWAKR